MSKYKTTLYFYIITIILIFFNAIMLIFPKEILAGAKNGLLLWYNNVIPALLPFMIFTAMLIKTGFPKRLGRFMSPICQRLFNISGEGAFAIIIGLISGCPLGAKTACDLYNQGMLTKEEAERLTIMCNNTGPLFVIGVVGESMLGRGSYGAKMLLIQYFTAILLGVFLGLRSKRKGAAVHKAYIKADYTGCNICEALSESVISGVNGITLVGGFIVLFSVICAILKSCGILDIVSALIPMDRQYSKGLIYGVLEVTNGMGILAGCKKTNYPIMCSVIAWGGLSIHAQSAAFMSAEGLSVKGYIKGKALQSALAYIIAKILYGFLR